MTTLSEKVREILNMHDSINSKVKSSVSSIDNEIIKLDKDIETLTNTYVQREIAGDTGNLSEVEKSIDGAIQEKAKLQLKKGAYGKVTLNNKALKDALPEVLDLARATQEERYKSIGLKNELVIKMGNDIKELQDKLEKVKQEIFTLNNKNEARELRPLLKYIEERKIKALFEESYLVALIGGCTSEELEQYIEEEVFEKSGPTSIMFNERQTN